MNETSKDFPVLRGKPSLSYRRVSMTGRDTRGERVGGMNEKSPPPRRTRPAL